MVGHVLGYLGQLADQPELVRVAQLALADRPGVRIEQRHDPVGDRLARDTLAGLPGDLLAPIRPLLQAGGGLQPRASAAPAGLESGAGREPTCLLDRALNSSPVSSVSLSTLTLASPSGGGSSGK